MKPVIAVAAMLSMIASIASAQPTTEPSAQMPARPGGGPGNARWMPLTVEEQTEALNFVRQHMPLLYDMIEEAPAQSPRHRRLVRFAVERYRWINRIQREQPELYEPMLSRLRTQDEVFELVRRYQTASEDERSHAYQQLREKVREVTQGIIEERQRRIDNLKRMLDREVQALERDRQNLEVMTDERLERLIGEMREMRTPAGEQEDR